MLDKIILSVEPFTYGLVILAGMHLAGWLAFTDGAIVGVCTVFVGVLLVIKHIIQTIRTKN